MTKPFGFGSDGQVVLFSNCIPHPVPVGQQEIASAVVGSPPPPQAPPIGVVPPTGPSQATTPPSAAGGQGELITLRSVTSTEVTAKSGAASITLPVLAVELEFSGSPAPGFAVRADDIVLQVNVGNQQTPANYYEFAAGNGLADSVTTKSGQSCESPLDPNTHNGARYARLGVSLVFCFRVDELSGTPAGLSVDGAVFPLAVPELPSTTTPTTTH